jgi:hypothetical protein
MLAIGIDSEPGNAKNISCRNANVAQW